MTAPAPDVAPLGVWDSSDWAHWPHLREVCAWAQEHFPGRGRRVYRAAFYLLDTPFVVLHSFAENDEGHVYEDPATGRLALAGPVTMLLSELPPDHLLAGAGAVGEHT